MRAQRKTAVEPIVFTPWISTLPGWKKHFDVDKFSATDVFPMHVGYAAREQFNFLFLVAWFKYTFLAPTPGDMLYALASLRRRHVSQVHVLCDSR